MTRRINLVPPSERARTSTDVGVLVMLVIGVLVVFGLGFGYYLLNSELSDKRAQLTVLEQQVAEVEAEVAALHQYELLAIQRDQVEAMVEGIYSARTTVSGVLDDISLVIPNTIWFQSLGLTVADPVVATAATAGGPVSDPTAGTLLSVEGKTYSFEEVAQLLVRFQLVPSLVNVELLGASDETFEGATEELKAFSIKGSVIDPSPEEILPLSEIRVDVP